MNEGVKIFFSIYFLKNFLSTKPKIRFQMLSNNRYFDMESICRRVSTDIMKGPLTPLTLSKEFSHSGIHYYYFSLYSFKLNVK